MLKHRSPNFAEVFAKSKSGFFVLHPALTIHNSLSVLLQFVCIQIILFSAELANIVITNILCFSY